MAATDLESATALLISNVDIISDVNNGDATTEVVTPSGNIPSLRKALADNLYFQDPVPWSNGNNETNFNQLRTFTDGTVWWSPSATNINPVPMGITPVGDSNWYPWQDINLKNNILEEVTRFKIKGTFAAGFTYETVDDVGLDNSGNPWSYKGSLPFTVVAGTVPSEPDYKQESFSNLDDIYNRTSTSDQAKKDLINNLEIGDQVTVSDYFNAPTEVVASSDSGYFYLPITAGGKKLKLLTPNGYANLLWFGANIEDGLELSGASAIELPESFTLTRNVSLPANVSLFRHGSECQIDATTLSNNAIEQSGSVKATTSMTSDTADQDSEMTLTDASQFNVNDVVRIFSTQANSWSGTWGAANRDYRKQNIRVITEKSGNTIYFDTPLNIDFQSASTQVDVLNTTTANHKNFRINLSNANNSRGLRIVYGRDNHCHKVSTNGGEILGVEYAYCLSSLHSKADSILTTPESSTQYTVAVSSSRNTVIFDSDLKSTRHAVAIVGAYQCENTITDSCRLTGSFPADAHNNADGYLYSNCEINGDNGIKIGGRNGEWSNCKVTSKNGTVIAAIEVYGGRFKIGNGTTIKTLSSDTFGAGWSPVDLGRGTGSITTDSRQDMEFIFDDVDFDLRNLSSFFIRLQNTSNYKVNMSFANMNVDYPSLTGGFFRYEGTPAGGDSDFINFNNNINTNTINALTWVQQGSGASGYDTANITVPLKQFLRPNIDGTSSIVGEFGKIDSLVAGSFDQSFGVVGTSSSAGRARLDANARFGDIRFGIGFDGSAQPFRDVWEITTGGSLQPVTDNSFTVGAASNRPSEIFAANGTINTSDERLKTPIESISEKEKACALEIKSNYGKFKWLDSVERESNGGKSARIHFGVGAQTVGKIFEKHGLNPDDYSVFCYDEWDDIKDRRVIENEEGEKVFEEYVRKAKGNIYGVRLEQLNAFILTAI